MARPTTALLLAAALGADAYLSPSFHRAAGAPPARLSRAIPALSRPLVREPAHVRAAAARSASAVLMADDAISTQVVKETPARSAVKAIGWRFTAGIVTACTSWFFTRSLALAASIVGWDLCSKSVTMFIGERLWNNVDWGKEAGGDTAKRSLAKAIAWRIFAALNT